jgi:pSer/pThr/pTyr-binding forkhead associated (FHA) protein
MHTLSVISGPAEGRKLVVDREVVIGREGADLTIDDSEMSRRHTVLRPVESGVEAEDLGSLNGTFVRGERIEGVVVLDSNAELRMGTTRFTLEVSPARDAPVAAPDVTAPRQIVTPSDVTAPRKLPPSDATAPRRVAEPGGETAKRRLPRAVLLAAGVLLVAAIVLIVLLLS